MRRDMAHLSRGQPTLDEQRRQQRGDEQQGQDRQTHESEV